MRFRSITAILRGQCGFRLPRSVFARLLADRGVNRLARVLNQIHMPEQNYRIETEQEEDGRWIAEIINLPGVMAYGSSRQEAVASVEALALRVLADQIEQTKVSTSRVSFGSA
jgi:predicted RNase H-like HicB family nuclease